MSRERRRRADCLARLLSFFREDCAFAFSRFAQFALQGIGGGGAMGRPWKRMRKVSSSYWASSDGMLLREDAKTEEEHTVRQAATGRRRAHKARCIVSCGSQRASYAQDKKFSFRHLRN